MRNQKQRTAKQIREENRDRERARREGNHVRRVVSRIESGDHGPPFPDGAETDVLPIRDAFGVAFDPTAERDPVDRTVDGRPIRSERMENREPRADAFVRDATGDERRVECITRRPGPDGEPAEYAVRIETGREFVLYGTTPVRITEPVPVR